MIGAIFIAILHFKGGVFKTTITANLGAALARLGFKVILLDFDLQQNLTGHFQPLIQLDEDVEEHEGTLYHAMRHALGFDHLITPTSEKNLFLIPGADDMVALDLTLAHIQHARDVRLKRCFRRPNS